jgi:hypothetical protein
VIAAVGATITAASMVAMRYGPTIARFLQRAAPGAERVAEAAAPRISEVETNLARPAYVIGETSTRVERFAQRIGAERYVENEAAASLSLGERAALNIAELSAKMRQGYVIYDIGLDADRDLRGLFYFVETGLMEASRYAHWVRVAP